MRNIRNVSVSAQGMNMMGNEDALTSLHANEYNRKTGISGMSGLSEPRRQTFMNEAAKHLDYLGSYARAYDQPYTTKPSFAVKQTEETRDKSYLWN